MHTARPGITHHHIILNRSWVRNLDEAQAKFDYGVYASHRNDHVAGTFGERRLRIV